MIVPVPTINQQLTDLVDSSSVLPEESLAGYSIDGVTPRAVVRPEQRQDDVADLDPFEEEAEKEQHNKNENEVRRHPAGNVLEQN